MFTEQRDKDLPSMGSLPKWPQWPITAPGSRAGSVPDFRFLLMHTGRQQLMDGSSRQVPDTHMRHQDGVPGCWPLTNIQRDKVLIACCITVLQTLLIGGIAALLWNVQKSHLGYGEKQHLSGRLCWKQEGWVANEREQLEMFKTELHNFKVTEVLL